MHSTKSCEWQRVLATFQNIWGYDDFRPPQGDIVHSLLNQQDALVVLPTGGGKSLCFQLPALMQTGLTLVVSPLVALMENQVQELQQRRLPARLLHSEVSASEKRKTFWQLQNGQLRLLYLSPETLLSPKVWECLSRPSLVINGLILDEAHCLVQWGDTFRPAYRRLGAVRPALLTSKPAGSTMAIAAFTATADPLAQRTITQTLQLRNPTSFLINPYRDNLSLQVQTVWTPKGRRKHLLRCIEAHPNQAGLIYVRTRKESVALAQWLMERGHHTAAYHAGLAAPERRLIEHQWLNGKMMFVVCTSAFGMGINHPSVRYVVHVQVPMLLSEYVQEVGRAGRDGKAAIALSLVSEPTGWLDPEDRQRQQFFLQTLKAKYRKALHLAQTLPQTGEVNAIAREFKDGAIALSLLHSIGQLDWIGPFHYRMRSQKQSQKTTTLDTGPQQMMAYLRTHDCRWRFLLNAFGFTQEAQSMNCGQCDRCRRSHKR
ncbi:MAG: RecQ family ATP-dependent DNA helicase [Cyanobacteria bacterium P01_A01_bin.37]